MAEVEFSPNETYQEIVLDESWKNHKPLAYFIYRADWENLPKSKTAPGFPIHLDIETTTHCNLKCPMCPRTSMIADGTFGEEMGFITELDFQNIIDQGSENGLKSIKLNYLGEPLLHKQVVEQVRYAKEKGILDVMMNTNGTALTPKMSKALLEAGLDNLFISFDAINPADWEVQRVGSTIGRVIDNVYSFSKLRKEINPGCQLRVSMVMYKEPKWLRQLDALMVMWEGIVDAVGYGFFVEHSDGMKGHYDPVPGFHCAQPFQRMFLKYNGNATICCFDSADEIVVGNWRTQKIKDVWNGTIYQSIRDMHSCGRYHEIDLCKKCYLPVSMKKRLEDAAAS